MTWMRRSSTSTPTYPVSSSPLMWGKLTTGWVRMRVYC
uniref:Uncharacterized protein n=1 Tax=Anguilla anguilla TaxID=7936 RepID=A0A0E9P907_ANGAN